MFHELCYNIFRCHCDRLDGTEFVFNENVGRPEHLEKRQYLLLNHDIKDKVVSPLFCYFFLLNFLMIKFEKKHKLMRLGLSLDSVHN